MRTPLITILVLLSLSQLAGCPLVTEVTVPGALVKTTHGEFLIELDPQRAPLAVANFLQYVDEDFYDGTFVHRVVAGSFVQAGGYAPGLRQKETRDPIRNESDNGLLNVRASVAMARTSDPNSATSQFYVNLADNPDLDPTEERPGYAVFGRIHEGMEVVDQIAAVPTGQRDGMSDVPLEDVLIEDIARTEIRVEDMVSVGARVTTSLGEFVIELDRDLAPLTVENFLQYVDDGFYAGTVIHRVVPGFVVQGGGFEPGLTERPTRPPIPNESANGLSNLRATVALAWDDDPNSAASQFVVNVAANLERDATEVAPGYTVFGRVIEGMEVLDAIASLATRERDGLPDFPVEDVVIEDIERLELPGGLELTPEGESYLEAQRFRVLTLIRELLVQALGYGLIGAVG